MRRQTSRTLLSMSLLLAIVQCGLAQERPTGPTSKLVFPASSDAVSEKQRILSDVSALTGRDGKPPNIGETKNLKDAHPETIDQLERLLDTWQKQMAAPAWPSKPQRRRVPIDGQTYEINI